MKLLREINESISISNVIEESNGENKKSLYIEGIFLQGNVKNRNNRIYPTEILEKEVERYNKEFIKENRALGELGHPQTPSINLERTSHMIVSLIKEGNNFIGKAKILGTPYGEIARNLLENGVKIGVSSRSLGTLKTMNEGYSRVNNDLKIQTAADIVADPSAPDAFVQSIMENKEWIYQGGVWVEQFIENAQKEIHNTSKVDLQNKAIDIFGKFLKKL